MTLPLYDSHCHLDFETFGDELDALVERARAAGITRVATIGSGRDVQSASGALEVARRFPDFAVPTIGVHPHDARVVTDEVFADMEALIRDPLVVAVGEVGLDFHYDHSPRDVQRTVFARFIDLARRVDKPIIVHTRSAPAETLEILRAEGADEVGGVIHCFSEDVAFARAALDLGFSCSFSGIVTFKSAGPIREASRFVPLDKLLVETDSPFLAPVPNRGKRNEPAYLAYTVAEIAKLRGQDEALVRRATFENTERFYRRRTDAPSGGSATPS